MQSNYITNPSVEEEYLLGRNGVHEALQAGREFRGIWFEKSLQTSNDRRINDIIAIAKQRHISIGFVPRESVEKVEHEVRVTSEGAVALVLKREELTTKDIIARCKSKNKEPFIILVNNILYEENVGAILRTCAAGGVDALIVPKREHRDLTPNVVRIAMGGAEYVPYIKDNLFESIAYLRSEGLAIIGVELNGSSYYYDADLTGPVAFVLGGENAGLTAPLQKKCDKVVKIPMIGKIQSLNVSVSTGLVIYEKIRQECQI